MNRIPKPASEDDDPTDEEEILDFDPTSTDTQHHPNAVSLDYKGKFASGVIDHDDRGQARWKWKTENRPVDPTERTYNLLKALDSEALRIQKEVQEVRKGPPRQSGYNPYDVGGPPKRKSRRKPR